VILKLRVILKLQMNLVRYAEDGGGLVVVLAAHVNGEITGL
jgi:hypothetical protein